MDIRKRKELIIIGKIIDLYIKRRELIIIHNPQTDFYIADIELERLNNFIRDELNIYNRDLRKSHDIYNLNIWMYNETTDTIINRLYNFLN